MWSCLGLVTCSLGLVLGLEVSAQLFSRLLNNLLACMHRKVIILFAQVNNKDCDFYTLH